MADWLMPAIAVGGFALTGGGILVAITRAVEKIKFDTSEKIATEVLAREKALAEAVEARQSAMDELRKEFFDDQRVQDSRSGEMGSALRRFIETVEKEMHKIEIWGRDNYVQKSEFKIATDAIRQDFKDMGQSIKDDIRDLTKRIDAKN